MSILDFVDFRRAASRGKARGAGFGPNVAIGGDQPCYSAGCSLQPDDGRFCRYAVIPCQALVPKPAQVHGNIGVIGRGTQ